MLQKHRPQKHMLQKHRPKDSHQTNQNFDNDGQGGGRLGKRDGERREGGREGGGKEGRRNEGRMFKDLNIEYCKYINSLQIDL